MNRFYLFIYLFSAAQLCGQSLPFKQSFEESTADNWSFTANPDAFNVVESNDLWDVVASSGYIDGASDGLNFWESRGFSGSSTNNCGYLTFETVDLVAIGTCTLSFDYYAGASSGSFEEEDGIGYELIFDDGTTWEGATHVELENDTSGKWSTVVLVIPESTDHLRLRLWAYTSAASEFAGFDNVECIEGTIPELWTTSPEDGAFFDNDISVISISGSATNLAGVITWSNRLNNASGTIIARDEWLIEGVALDVGLNSIFISATNLSGSVATRRLELSRSINFPISELGTIAFTGFNTQTDSLSFVVLKDLDPHTLIRFTDEEWDGFEFGGEEGDLVWSNSSVTAAGRVIVFYNCNSSSAISNNNIGSIVSGSLDLSQSGEGVIAYYGGAKREPSSFLAAISTAGENLNGSGLIYGQSAIDLSRSPVTQFYSGSRSGQREWHGYLPLINDAANWSSTIGMTESYGEMTPFQRERRGTVINLR